MFRDILLHNVDALDCRRILSTLATGRCVCSPFSAGLVKKIAA